MNSVFIDFNEHVEAKQAKLLEKKTLSLTGTSVSPFINYHYGDNYLEISGNCSNKHLIKISKFIMNIILNHFRSSEQLNIIIFNTSYPSDALQELSNYLNEKIKQEMPEYTVIAQYLKDGINLTVTI